MGIFKSRKFEWFQMVYQIGELMCAHNGLYTPQGAEKDYRNDIDQVIRGNNKRIETFIPKYYELCKNCSLLLFASSILHKPLPTVWNC